VNESGLLYTLDELQAIGEVARVKKLVLHMDGVCNHPHPSQPQGLSGSPSPLTLAPFAPLCSHHRQHSPRSPRLSHLAQSEQERARDEKRVEPLFTFRKPRRHVVGTVCKRVGRVGVLAR
jgi:hypothetical protein